MIPRLTQISDEARAAHRRMGDRLQVDAVKVSAVKGPETNDHYCMLDSGANVMVIPWKEGMEGESITCALVGNSQAEGLIVT